MEWCTETLLCGDECVHASTRRGGAAVGQEQQQAYFSRGGGIGRHPCCGAYSSVVPCCSNTTATVGSTIDAGAESTPLSTLAPGDVSGHCIFIVIVRRSIGSRRSFGFVCILHLVQIVSVLVHAGYSSAPVNQSIGTLHDRFL